MKNPRLHRKNRSFAHSAAAAVIVLAAVLTSAAPVAADTAPPADESRSRTSECSSAQNPRQGGLDMLVRAILLGPESMTDKSQCQDGAQQQHQQQQKPQENSGRVRVVGPVLVP
ncbi:hypothetical protein KEF29_26825 [Streptomyces tuirus]|uniref:Secreted protein n=1 Tax=Streptomyces tuirus TaxID=68278 RepID=A0A941FK21_9ACTN|nr:hypothetical protein [Streptomyces tuirus]